MSTLDLEQQEQLDQIKHFWSRHGGTVTTLLTLVMLGYVAWMGYQRWTLKQAESAAALYDELDRSAQSHDAQRVSQIFGDIKAHYGHATMAEQGALLVAKVQLEAHQYAAAQEALQWVIDEGKDPDLVAVARLRLAGIQMDAKQFDLAVKTLSTAVPQEFEPLVNDRLGDIAIAQGKSQDAIKDYQAAWKAMSPKSVYRREILAGKLMALGQAPESFAQAASAAGVAQVNNAP